MNSTHFTNYLKDHFAGSVAALELLDHLIASHQLALLEKLQALALGIEGKQALWRSLLAIVDETPALRGLDLPRLDQRAEDQRQRVERARIEVAREAFIIN